MKYLLLIVMGCLITPVHSAGQSNPVSQTETQSPELAEANLLNRHVAALYYAGEYEKALPLARRVLTIREKLLGPDHSLVAESLRDLAKLLSAANKNKEAVTTYQRFVTTFEKTIEGQGPEMVEVLEEYVCLLMDNGGNNSNPNAALEIQKRLYRLENGFDFNEADNHPVKKLAKGGLLINKRLQSETPRYPEERMFPRVSGLVIMKLKVDEQGKVVSATRLCGHHTLASAFEKTLLKTTYAPTLIAGKPTKVSAIAMHQFNGLYKPQKPVLPRID